ncbi:junctional protein associated with coronary artery disease homolog [Oncorhynchus kisutch]|uniref:Junctional protein associated with coronary artery disease homolog n=1 Tax=Oncorhynchus kisutch TaxID=8019 RepID=A0A8C7IIB4_ONCKI|nr:junctional protein associated with coronary artery disease homolog [Oncorhynchus kisutch]
MYSVDDLLISHGYKLPKTSVPCPSSTSSASAPCEKQHHVAATTDCHREIPAAENQRPGRVGSLNGYEQAADRGACVFRSSSRQALLAKVYPGSGDNESGGERNQRRKEAGSGNLGDSLAQPLGDSLATDSGFYDAPSLTYSEQIERREQLDERDVSYWRRRGQDFSVLLDYADGRELRASASFLKASEVAWRPQALIAEDHRGEREKQQQKQLWDDTPISWLREADAAPGQLRVLTGVTGERKCQSLGTEEWKPAVGLGRQLSDGEGERWAQDQQHRLRTPESAGFILPRTRGKSQSLPRVLSPDGTTEHTDTQSSLVSVQLRPGQVDRQRVNSTVFSGPYSRYYHSAAVGRDRWARNSWQSGGHVALLPKPRFSRPVKPPSYEIHQQTRGSQEMLSVAVVDEQSASKQQKDNRPVYHPRGGELQRQDYFAQHSAIFGMEPPGYIPPPSYKRAPPPIRGGPINRNEVVNYKWRGEMQIQMQMPVSSETGRWFSRQTGGSWLEHYGDRGIPYRKQVNPGYTEEHLGHVHYLPFDDPRVRHISGGPGGNSLTDTDKLIRNINKEIPCAKVLGQSTHDSAFSPPHGLSLNTDSRKTSVNDNDGSSTRWCHRGLINKGSVDSVAPDQSCGNYPTAFQVRPPPQQIRLVDQGVSETVTQVKKKEPDSSEKEKPRKPDSSEKEKPRKPDSSEKEKPRKPDSSEKEKPRKPDSSEKEKPRKPDSSKKKLSETIFCLVSVPIPPTPGSTSHDQNNNDEKPPSPVRPPSPVDSPSENKTGHLTNQSLQSTSSAEAELQALTGSIASSRSSSKIVRKLPIKPPKINHHKELKLSGSWPGNQYRDQETQTSPEARKRQPPPPPPPGPENKEAQDPQVPAPGSPDPGVTPDPSSVGSTAFSYPIKGVKSLKPSSNSAFSRTATFSISSQLNKSTAQPPAAAPPPPPSGNTMEVKPAATCSGQEGFGQFLLKPVSRRPWDAIEELETINKELQDQQQQPQQQSSKRPSVDQCIEDLNEAYKDILELGTASNNVPNNGGAVQIPERIKIRLAGEAGLSKPSSLRRSIESWTVSVDPEYREVKSAFSRPAERKSVTFSKQLREELPVPPRDPTGFREYRVVSNLSQRRSSCSGRSVKLDLSSPSETPPPCDFTGPSDFIDSPSDPSEIRDLSPTTPTTHTAAEVPWADRQPMQDASTLTSPPDYEDICQSLQKTRDSTEVNKTLTAKSKLGGGRGNAVPPGGASLDSEEECPICKKESESQMSRPSPMSPLHEESSPDLSDQSSATIVGDSGSPQGAETYVEPAEDEVDTKLSSVSCSNRSEAQTLCQDWREQLSLTDDKNVGGCAAAEKTNQNQATKDLNILYEVKCAEGIPENESIEERAARILGIDVPAESLVTGERRAREPATDEIELRESEPTAGEDPERSNANEQTLQTHVRDTESGELRSTASMVPNSGQEFQENEPPQDTPERIRSAKWTQLGRETPGMLEFPPDRLPLSVPMNPDQKLSHSLEGERRGRGASQHIEALQDKLAASPSHQVAIERLARMKVVDSVSRMRLSIRSTDSGEVDGETEREASRGVEQVEENAVLPAPSQSDTVDDREVNLEDDREASEDTVLQDEEVSSVSEA